MAGVMQYFIRELLSDPWYPDPGKPPDLLYYSCFGERITVTCIQFFASVFGTELLFAYIFLPLSLQALILSQGVRVCISYRVDYQQEKCEKILYFPVRDNHGNMFPG